jgi:hypothetical protein
VSVTIVDGTNGSEHEPLASPAAMSQAIPVGLLVTRPAPSPVPTTVSVNGAEKVAVTACTLLIVTTQVAVPLHAPPHPANELIPEGVAVSVTSVPCV